MDNSVMEGESLALNNVGAMTWLRNCAVATDCAWVIEMPGLSRATTMTQKVDGSLSRSLVPHHSLRTRVQSDKGIKKSWSLPGVRCWNPGSAMPTITASTPL